MNSHFCVILLCLSSVYCISSTFDNLSHGELIRILIGETAIKELGAAIDQKVIYKHQNGRRTTTLDVKVNLLDFKERDELIFDEDYFERSREVIKLAYQCTLTKYACISTWLIYHDLSQLKKNINEAIRITRENPSDIDAQTILSNESFKTYYLDLDFKLNSDFQLFNVHDLGSKKNIYLFWASMIEKTLGIKINYKIFTDVIRTKFTNEYDHPLVDTINELICVHNESIQMYNNFIAQNCVQRTGSFYNNFRSLKNGVRGDFISVLMQFDEMKTTGTDLGLFKDYTISVPGTLPTIAAIKASGCFVDVLEYDISGFKMILPNGKDPTEIYGHDFVGRLSETTMKLVKSTAKQPQKEIKVGMVKFRDGNWSGDDPQTSGSATAGQHDENV